jgi:hypothetical protein
MGISKAIAAQLQNASWIRRMFEEELAKQGLQSRMTYQKSERRPDFV